MKIEIKKGVANGRITAPPSKSVAHRLLICAALCEGKSTVHNISSCADVSATLSCLTSLGIQYELSGSDVTITGKNPRDIIPVAPLECNESGSTLRFFVPIALMSGHTTVFYGTKKLMERPMHIYQDICQKRNLTYICDDTSIVVKGPIKGGEYTVAGNISSQFISGLLFALPCAEEDSIIKITPPIESRSYIELTLEALKNFGVNAVWKDEHTLFIPGKQNYTPCDINVEGDYSGAVFTDSLNLFGGNVTIDGLSPNTLQGDSIYRKHFEMLSRGIPTIHIGDCPDLGPILFAIAAAKSGGIFTGTNRLKIKESDRAAAMAEELQKFGTKVTVYQDTTVIYPSEFHPPKEMLYGHNDHRIVMALSILLSLTGGTLDGAEAVSKSYPDFFNHIKSLGIEVSIL